jgi:hypothetical protein
MYVVTADSVLSKEPEYINELREKLRVTKSKLRVNPFIMRGRTNIAFKNCAKYFPDHTAKYTLCCGNCMWGYTSDQHVFGTYITSKNLIIFINDDETIKVVTEVYELGSLSLTYENNKLKYIMKIQRTDRTALLQRCIYTYTIENNKVVGLDHDEVGIFQFKLEWKGSECNINMIKVGEGYAAAIVNDLRANEIAVDTFETIKYKPITLEKPGNCLEYFQSGVDIDDPETLKVFLFIKPKQRYGYHITLPYANQVYVRILEMNLSTYMAEREIHVHENMVIYEKKIGLNITHAKWYDGERANVKVTYDDSWCDIYTFNKTKLENIDVVTRSTKDNSTIGYKINIIDENKFTITGDTPNMEHIRVALGINKLETELSNFEYM